MARGAGVGGARVGDADPLVHYQLVPSPRSGLQKLGRGGINLDFLPQPVHELLEELPVAGIPVPPDLDEQPIGAHGVPRIRQ